MNTTIEENKKNSSFRKLLNASKLNHPGFVILLMVIYGLIFIALSNRFYNNYDKLDLGTILIILITLTIPYAVLRAIWGKS